MADRREELSLQARLTRAHRPSRATPMRRRPRTLRRRGHPSARGRAEILSLRTREFVIASRALGGSSVRTILRHLLPNVVPFVIVIATLEVGRVMLLESALSFLGLGVRPPTPSWGAMLAEGRIYVGTAWWLATFPGLAISVTVLSLNIVGDWLRDLLDPELEV